jgi:hypothetical protein
LGQQTSMLYVVGVAFCAKECLKQCAGRMVETG